MAVTSKHVDRDLRISVRVRNNQIQERREAMGLSAAAVAEKIGLPAAAVRDLEAMRAKPMTKAVGPFGRLVVPRWRDVAVRLAEFFGVTPEELFPDAVVRMEKVAAEVRVSAEQMAAMLAPSSAASPLALLESAESQRVIDDAIGTLTAKEQVVVRRRFGFAGDGGGETLDEIAQRMGVTRERIRQIEAKALRKLRHPSHRRLIEVAS